MGREVRRVPPNWIHPRIDQYGRSDPQPMYDETFDHAAMDWKERFARFEADRPSGAQGLEFWEWDGPPPDRAYYRPWSDDEATWFQAWETVSEGTPVSPPFMTKEALIEHLVRFGDDWDRKRGDGGWKRSAAEAFVKGAYAPSMVVVTSGPNKGVYGPRDGFPEPPQDGSS